VRDKTTLTIAIPTYNRAARLSKALSDLLRELSGSANRESIQVLVSDNASPDSTSLVLKAAVAEFQRNSIDFRTLRRLRNDGPRVNALSCLMEADTDYVWLLSDDDNLLPGAVDVVYAQLRKWQPSVAIFEFNQGERQTDASLDHDVIFQDTWIIPSVLTDLIDHPKLSRVIYGQERKETNALDSANKSDYYPHVIAALEIGWRKGRILAADFPVGAPDEDFMDHIDFVPYVSGFLMQDVTEWARNRNITPAGLQTLVSSIGKPNVLSGSLSFLRQFENGKRFFPDATKRILEENVARALRGNLVSSDGLKMQWTLKAFVHLVLLGLAKLKRVLSKSSI